MSETKTYSVVCPDEECARGFDVIKTAEDLADGGELIACPACGQWWEWDIDGAAGTLELLPEEEEEEEDEGQDEEEEEDEDQDEEEEEDEDQDEEA